MPETNILRMKIMQNIKRIIGTTFVLFALIFHVQLSAWDGCYSDPCCDYADSCCDDSGFYFGTQVGYVNTHWNNIDQNAFALSEIVVKKDYGAGVRPFLGYAVNKYFALELGWTYLNRATIDRWNAFDFHNVHLTHIENMAYDVSMRLSVPLFCNAGLFTRLGLAYLVSNHSIKWRANSLQDIDATPFRHNPSTYNVTFGFGAYYDLPCNLRAEIAWTRYEGYNETTDNYQPSPDFYSIGLSYKL